MLLCVRGYIAYPLSLRHLEQMMIDADDNEHTLRFAGTLNQKMPGFFELSTPNCLPAARCSHTICVTWTTGRPWAVRSATSATTG
jgi:hypothetical protein